jgi:signal transduction histidine kinase
VRVGMSEDGRGTGAGRRISVDVADTGPGIPKEKQHLLFQEFVRLDPRAETGAGIGLAISRRLACAMGGDITLESELGTGSTFTLWLPVAKARENAGEQTGPS